MESYCSLCTLDTIHRLLLVIRLIINKINKVQWMDFKLENVLVSLHSLKTMDPGSFRASAPLFLRNGELLGHSPIHIKRVIEYCSSQCIILHSHARAIWYTARDNIYIIMWSCPRRVICLSDLGNIFAYYLNKTTLISLLYWVSNCPGNMPKILPR